MRLQLRSSLVKPAKKVIGKQRLTVLVNVSFPAPISTKREAVASLFCQRNESSWRGSKAVMPRIANPVSPVRLRTAPPDTVCSGKVMKPSGQRRKQRSFQGGW